MDKTTKKHIKETIDRHDLHVKNNLIKLDNFIIKQKKKIKIYEVTIYVMFALIVYLLYRNFGG